MFSKIKGLFRKRPDEELEEMLIKADVGVSCTERLLRSPDSLKENVLEILSVPKPKIEVPLRVILIVGVNGSGKTTSTAKLAKHYSSAGKKVLIAAADTFRAAATEQLTTWATRLNIDIITGSYKSDPSSVVYDAIQAAQARGCDILLIDTAGRLESKSDLMEELTKITRTCNKLIPGSPHETLLVIDATTGQNGLDQARTFHKQTPLTGLILAKFDGTAKGGIALAIHHELGLPVEYVGIGEGADDLTPFNPHEYTKSLFSN